MGSSILRLSIRLTGSGLTDSESAFALIQNTTGRSIRGKARIGGLDYVGFEINAKYFEAANRRLEEEKAQIRLFDLLEEQEKATQTTLF